MCEDTHTCSACFCGTRVSSGIPKLGLTMRSGQVYVNRFICVSRITSVLCPALCSRILSSIRGRANLKPSIRGSLVSVFKWRPYLFYNLFLSSFAERRVFNFCIICPSLRDDCQLAISRTIYYYCSCSSFKVVVSFFRTFSLKCIHCYIIRNIKTSFRWVKFKTWFRWLPLVSDSIT